MLPVKSDLLHGAADNKNQKERPVCPSRDVISTRCLDQLTKLETAATVCGRRSKQAAGEILQDLLSNAVALGDAMGMRKRHF